MKCLCDLFEEQVVLELQTLQRGRVMRTRWEILAERLENAKREHERLSQQIQGLVGTLFRGGTGSCATCGVALRTEADFAAHYVVPDERYLLLGNCPSRYNGGKLMPPLYRWGKSLEEEAYEEDKVWEV